MVAPGWLTTDPDPIRIPKRIRPGWAPRPSKKVSLVHGWAKPEEMGAGQGLVSGAEGSWEEPWVPPVQPAPAPPPPPPVEAEPTPDLTPPVESGTLPPEAGTSVPTPAASQPSRGVLSGGTTGSTAARAGVSSGAKAPPPQGPPSAPRPTTAAAGTKGRAVGTLSGAADPKAKSDDVRSYIIQAAKARGIDPNVALRVANSEGGTDPARRGTFKTGSSWWPFQLHYGGAGYEQYGDVAGMGNSFTAKTGFKPGDPAAWQASVDYALDHAATNGWGAWYGAKAQGITGFDGIGNAPPVSQQRVVIKSDAKGRRGVQSVIDVGMTAIGTKYQWGGSGGRSDFEDKLAPTDCSGFVAWAYQRATGTKLPAYTGSIWDTTRGINADDAAPGDLVMYNMGKGAGLQHVGIYMGNGQMLHDSSVNPNGGVDITPLWGNPSFRRVDGVDPEQAHYGGTDNLTRVRSRTRAARIARDQLNPDEWTKFVPEQAFVPDQPEQGAGQEGFTDGGGGGSDANYDYLNTKLEPGEEQAFERWKARFAPNDSGFDYDLRGAFKAGLTPNRAGHFSDTYKKPNHPTFSIESQYAERFPDKAGRWEGDRYQPPVQKMGAGQEEETEEQRRQREEAERIAREEAERERQEIEDAQRRQAEADALAQTPEWWSDYQGKSYPISDALIAAPGAFGAAASAFGGAADEVRQRLGRDTERLRTEVGGELGELGESIGGAADVLGTTVDTARSNVGRDTERLRSQLGQEIGGGFSALGSAVDVPFSRLGEDTERLRAQAGTEVGAIGAAVEPRPGELPAPGLATPPSRFTPQPAPAEPAAPAAPPPSRFTQPPEITPQGPGLGEAAGAAVDLVGGPSEAYPSGGPLAGPITGGLREVTGIEQQVREFEEKIGMPLEEFHRQVEEDLERVRSGQQAEPDPELTRLRLLENETINQAGAIGAYARAPAEEQTKTELTGGAASAAISTALLPGNIALTPGGIARAGLALAVDPSNIPFQGVGEAFRLGGKVLRGAEEAAQAADTAQKARAAAVKAAQSAELAATPEGKSTVDALALAADPRTVAHGGGGPVADQVRRGGQIINQITPSADAVGTARNVARTAVESRAEAHAGAEVESFVEQAVKLSRVEEAGFNTAVADAARMPLDPKDEIKILQEASIHFDSKALEDSADEMARAVASGRAETLTGAQMRRHLLREAAKSNVRHLDFIVPEQLLDDADYVLSRAGREDLTHRAAIAAGVVPPDDVLKVSAAWNESTLVREAEKIFAERGREPSLLSRAGGLIPPTIGRATAGVAGGAPGYAIGAVLDDSEQDPSSSSYPPSKLIGGLAGFGLAAIGVPYAGALISKHWTPQLAYTGSEILAPVKNRSPEVQRMVGEWISNINAARQLGDNFTDQVNRAWGEAANSETARHIELTGQLPKDLRGNKEAEDVLDYWKRIADWARQFGIIEEPIMASRAKLYMPHVLDEEWKQAAINARDIPLGRAYDSVAATTRQVSANPFWYYTQPRVHETMFAGRAKGVEYTNEVAKMLGSYYQRAVEKAAHHKLMNDLVELAAKNDPSIMTRAEREGLFGTDVIKLDPDSKIVVKGGKRVNDLLGFQNADLKNVMVSEGLHRNLSQLLSEGTRWSSLPGLNFPFKANDLLRSSVLSGVDIYQMAHTSAAMFGLRGGTAGINPVKHGQQFWKAREDIGQALQFMMQPEAYRQWANSPATLERQTRAMRDGLMLTLSDRPNELTFAERWMAAALNTSVSGIAGYQGTLAAGGDQDDAIANALKTAGIGAFTSMPMFGSKFKGPGLRRGAAGFGVGKEQASLIQAVGDGTWNRFIPYLKLMSYELYRDAGRDGRAAAELVNEIMGGQNIQAIARSRNTQDALRIVLMTPDWQEGFARSIGNSLLNWKTPIGHMNRVYWANILVSGAVGLEALNLALGGNWSWQNDPDKVLTVKVNNLYDLAAKVAPEQWSRTNPKTGQQQDVYWDLLGPFRSIMEPMVETSRWGLAAAYEAMGTEADDLPLSNEIRGNWNQHIPKPDPSKAWTNFLRARQGWILAAAPEVIGGKDFAGKPLDREEDPMYQRAINRVWSALQNTIPAGLSDVTRGQARGDMPAAIAFQYITGHRVEYESPATRQATAFDQWLEGAHRSDEDWRKMRDDARKKGYDIDKEIEALVSGLQDGNKDKAKPGESDMTSRARTEQIERLSAQRKSVFQQRYDMLANMPEGPDKDALKTQLQELQKYNVVGGGPVPSDLRDRKDITDIDEIVRQAWNKDPKEVARLQGKATGPQNFLETIAEGGRKIVERMEPGYDEKQALAELRSKWMTETADKYQIDLAVLQDLVKAQVYEVTDSEGDFTPPVLNGVTSQQLDEIGDAWRTKGFTENNDPIPDSALVARERQKLIMEHATALHVDPEALTQRVKLRNMPLMDTSPAAISRSHALDVLHSASFFEYVDPKTGQPMGTPKEWEEWDNLLEGAKNRFEYRESHGMGFFYKRNEIDTDLTNLQRAKEQARADKYHDIIMSQHAEDYYRWFGDGANMTDKQWKEYRAGTLDMYADKPSTAEAQRRTEAMRIWAALTPDQRNKYGIPEYGGTPVRWDARNEFGRMAPREGSLAAYMQYINTYRTKKYLLEKNGKEVKDANGNPTPLLGDIDPSPSTPLS